MAVLNDADRKTVWAEFMSTLSARREACSLKKAELRAAVDAIDAWVDANATAFNAAIPQPARTALTAKQKAEVLMFVVSKRWGAI
jgi:hypothetical protein